MQIQKMKIVTLAFVFFVVSAAYAGPLPPPAEMLPKGFKVVEEQNMSGAMSMIKATAAKDATIEVAWQMNPMAGRMIDMMAGKPEEKTSHAAGLTDEPCGKQSYRGGVFTCRKWTQLMVGTDEGSRVTLRIGWQGSASGGLVSINIQGASRETAMKWLDSMIPKITKAK